MTSPRLRWLGLVPGLALALLAGVGAAPAAMAASTADGAEPAASAASAPAPRRVSEIVARLATSQDLQRAALQRLPEPQQWQELAHRADKAEAEFARLLPHGAQGAQAENLVSLSHDVWTLGNEAAAIVHDLTTLSRRVERDLAALDQDAAQWSDDLATLRGGEVPAPVLASAQAAAQQTRAAAARAREARDQALLGLVRVQALQTQLHDATAQVATRMDKVLTQRERLESTAIWRLGEDAGGSLSAVSKRLEGSALLLRAYLVRHGGELALAFALCFLLCLWLFRRPAPAAAPPAQRAWGRPVAASLMIALVVLFWLAPNPPFVFFSLLVLAIPLPMALIGRRSFAAPAPRTLNGLALATMVFALRSIIDASALADRLLLLVQLASFAVPLLLDLRGGGLYKAFARFSPESVRAAAIVVLGLCALSALHALFGSAGPSRGVRVGAAGAVGFGLIFATTVMAVYGALLSLMGTPLLGWLRSARQPDPALLRALRVLLFLTAVGATAVTTLGAMTLIPDALSVLDSAARGTVDIGVLTVSAAALATALAVVIGTFVLSAMVHFVLDREVFPRLQLRPGAGYAIATFARWLIFIAGGVLTLAALGVDPSRITLLAGAVGVGVGFGLQTVVNNFVSGLILIVERPVAVGDLIEIGPLLGEIQRIGIRSSSLRTTHGAEVIVPNSDLASKEVVNWTRSDRQRRYDIDVGVAYGSDPEQVMRLLVEAAREVPEVMAKPAPMAMFKGFGDSSLDFRLLAWVSTIDLGLQAQNALRVAVLAKLDAAGITMPFPQREVRLVTVPAPAAST